MSTIKIEGQALVIDSTGKELEKLDLGVKLSGEKVNPKTYACAVRVLLQNWRQGTVSCKGRSQVAFSNKKPWRQKGTGRARAGSARSPIWRKGGVTFGPSPRVRELKINRKQKKACLKSLFGWMLENNAIYCVDHDFGKQEAPKTKQAYGILKGMGVEKKKGVLFLPYDDVSNFAAFRNIPSVGALSFDQPNVFDLSGTSYWIFLKKDLEQFKNMVEKWI